MEEVFDKNETEYLRWAVTNQQTGFIVNTDHDHRSPVYPMVHRATHKLVTSAKIGNFTTGRFFKVCSTEMSDLEAWARRERGRFLHRCGTCM